MNTLSLLSLALCALLLGCKAKNINSPQHAAVNGITSVAKAVPLTPEQERFIRKYDKFKKKILWYLGLDAAASEEAIRHALLSKLELPLTTSWADLEKAVFAEPMVQDALTEEKRMRYVIAFDLPADASWRRIWETLERVSALLAGTGK